MAVVMWKNDAMTTISKSMLDLMVTNDSSQPPPNVHIGSIGVSKTFLSESYLFHLQDTAS